MIYPKLNLHIVTPSTWLADLARESTLLKNFPITVIPNCLDTDVFKPVDKVHVLSDLGLNNSKKKILFGAVNALNDSNKGFKQLIEALSHFEHSVDCSKYELLVFGTDKPINEIQTPLQIHYLGYIKQDTELVKVYNAADVMVVPSLSEVFGQTASEAMACGTPVVAFNCTGIKEVVEHKITGYLAEPYSPEDLATGILWCEQNNVLGELSVNARNRVVENYSVDRVAAKYKALYENLF
jgi:glycosyltransferase involved in cell wall biosynthesis